MKFPVDLLAGVGHSELEQRAQSYMKELLYSDPECPEQLTLADSTQVDISISSVGFVPLYGSCDKYKVLVLFAPKDPFTPVALYLLDQWWTVSDVLHTADSQRDGLVQVDTLGERIVLYVLNRIVYRVQEMRSDELPFLCHGEEDFAKILWNNGEAVGFYSVKATGSPCSSFSSRTYPLPVMDSLFVRKCYRGKGLGLRMLEDYVDSFREDSLGLRYPLTTAMYKVCQCYLQAFPGDSELLWEVDSSRLNQRTSIANKIHNMNLTGVSRTLTFSAESAVSAPVQHMEENAEEVTTVKASKGAGPAGQKNTDEQFSRDQIRSSEAVTLLRLVPNTELVQTEELLEVTTENVMGIVVTELQEDAMFDKVSSEEECLTLDSEEVTKSLKTLCSSVITVENVVAEVEECLNSQEQCTEKSSHKTAPPEVMMQRVLRTRPVVNIPQPSTVGEVDGDADKPVDESEITQELKNDEDVTTENQTNNEMEETQTLHRIPLRALQSSIGRPKVGLGDASMRLNKVQESSVTANTQEHEADKEDRAEEHENEMTYDAVQTGVETGVKECLTNEVTNEEENREAIEIVTREHPPCQETLDKEQETTQESTEEQSKECVAPVILSEGEDNDSQPETKMTTEDCQLAPSQTKDPGEASDTAAAVTEEVSCRKTIKLESLSSTQGETEEVVETRALRSSARSTSTIPTARTTRSRTQNVDEETLKTTAIRRAKKLTGRKQVSKSKEQTQELEASSAEDDTKEEAHTETSGQINTENNEISLAAEVDNEEANNDEPVKDSESTVVAETQDIVSKEVKNHEPALVDDDPLHKENEEVKGETEITVEETAVMESTCATTEEEEKSEEVSSTADVESVLIKTTEAEETEQTESIVEIDKESQPETVMELSVGESGIDQELEPESIPEEPIEAAPVIETRSLGSGTKTVTSILKHSHTADNETVQPETPDSTQEVSQTVQDSTEEQSKEHKALEITPEAEDKGDAQSETNITTEVLELAPSQTKDAPKSPAECPEEESDEALAIEEVLPVAPVEQGRILPSKTKEVVERRSLRSTAKPTSIVSTPRTTRRSAQKATEVSIQKTTKKQAKKSTGRKRVSKSMAQTQELEASAAEDGTTEEAHTEISGQTATENNEISLAAEVDNEEANNDEPVKDPESTVVAETQDIVSKEVSKNHEPAPVDDDPLHKENEEVKGETEITVEETAVMESICAKTEEGEKSEEVSSTVDMESVLLKTTEAEETEQTESIIEIDKESQPKTVMELSVGESGIDQELEPECIPEEPTEAAPVIETRSLGSGPKTVTSILKHSHTADNETVQPETPDSTQEVSQTVQDSTEEQSKEHKALEITPEAEDKGDAQSETNTTTEVLELAPSQTKDSPKLPAECPEEESSEALAIEEVLSVAPVEQGNLSPSKTKEVVERRSLRSRAKPTSVVSTPRTTRRSAQKATEVIVQKITIKQAKKSTGRKRVSKSTAQTQEIETSAAEDGTTQEAHTETSGQTTTENNETSLAAEVDNEEANNDEPVKDPESTVVAETQDIVLKEVSKNHEPAPVDDDTLHKENEEVKGETEITVEETAVMESTCAKTEEEELSEEVSSTADVESVLLKTTEAEETEQTESIDEMNKESQPETAMELSVEESGIDQELEPESIPEEHTEATPVIETRSSGSGPKIVTGTLKHNHTADNETVQPETPDRPQEEPHTVQDSREEQSKEHKALEITSEAEDKGDAQSETNITTEVLELAPSQTEDAPKSPAECPEEESGEVLATEDVLPVAPVEQGSLSPSETKEVVETRSLRSRAKPTSIVSTPRTTRRSAQKVTEVIVKKTTIKQVQKSTGGKQVSKSKAQTQELEASAAEDGTTEEAHTETSGQTTIDNNEISLAAEVENEEANNDEPVKDSESTVVPETQDIVLKEVSKNHEPKYHDDGTLHKENEEVKGETEITVEETAVMESICATTEEEEKSEEVSSTADVESVLLKTAEAEETEQTESIIEMNKESQPETVMELSVGESGIDQELEPESISEEPTEALPVIETRFLGSGPKTVTSILKHSHTADNETVQPETADSTQEVSQTVQDSTEEQSKEHKALEITSEAEDKGDAQSETNITTEVLELAPSQTKDAPKSPAECLEEESSEALAIEEVLPVAPVEQGSLSPSKTKDVVERRSLRSRAKPTSIVSTPRTTRRSAQKATEVIFEKTTIKQGKKSTGRKRVSKSKAQTQELEASAAEDGTTEEAHTEISGQTTTENNEISLAAEVENEEANNDEPVKDSESTVVAETQDVVSKELSKNQEPVPVDDDTLHKENEEVKGETEITVEETAVMESTCAKAEEEGKSEEISSTADVESVLLKTIEAEETEETESIIDIYKESQPETAMELSLEESSVDQELEPESIPEEPTEAAPVIETRSLGSGPKTVTSIRKHSHTADNETVQPETPDRPQEEPQTVQDSTEEQPKECKAPEISSEAEEKGNAQSETIITTEVIELAPSQSKDDQKSLAECPEEESGEALATEEVLPVAPVEQGSLSPSKTKEVVETRSLRSRAKLTSIVSTPRTTRRSAQKATEVIVEKTTIKQVKKLTGRKRVSKSKAQTQEHEASAAEDGTTEEAHTEISGQTATENNETSLAAEVENEEPNNDEPVKDPESTVVAETQDIVLKEVSKNHEPSPVDDDTLHKENEEVKDETEITVEETAVMESTCAKTEEEEKSEEVSSTADVESVLLKTTEAEETEQTESIISIDKESQPETVIELSVGESGIDQELEPESIPEEPTDVTSVIEEQSKECKALEITPEAEDKGDAQSETTITTEVLVLAPSQTMDVQKSPAECLEEESGEALATEEVLPVAPVEKESLSPSETKEVVERRSLRSRAKPTSIVSTPRTTRRSAQKVTEVIVEKTTIKQAKKSTGRKRLSKSMAQTQELEVSAAEDGTTEEAHTETSGQTTTENNEISLPAEVDNEEANNDEPVKDSESTVVAETQDIVSKEVSKNHEPAPVDDDTLHKENEEVKDETESTVEETNVMERTHAKPDQEGKSEAISSTADVESVLLSTFEAEDTEQIESTIEMDKESQVEAVMELSVEESGIDQELEPESIPKRPQEEPQNEQDSTEEQLKECDAPEIPSEEKDKDGDQSEIKIITDVFELAPSQTKDTQKDPAGCLEEASNEALATEEVPSVAPVEQENISPSETEEVFETRALRSRARTTNTVSTPRTTRHSKRKAVEVIVETATIKQAKKSTGRKHVSRSELLNDSSAEDDTTEEAHTETSVQTTTENNETSLAAEVENEEVNKYKLVKESESTVATEIPGTVSKEEEQEAAVVDEDDEIKDDTDVTVEETAIVESSSAEAVEEVKSEVISSTADVESVLLSTTEAEGTEKTESIMETEKESQLEAVIELSVGESGIDKESEPEPIPDGHIEVTPILETRSVTVTSTLKPSHTADNETIQPETSDRPQEPQNLSESTEEQSKECDAPEIPPEAEDKITTEVLELAPFQTKYAQKDPAVCSEEASVATLATEEVPSVAPVVQESLSLSETEEVVETRSLRSRGRPTNTVSTPIATRRSKRKAVDVTVEKATLKQVKKSTGGKPVSRSEAQTQELKASSVDDDTTEANRETLGQTTIENNDISLPVEVENEGLNNSDLVNDSESTVETDTQDTISREVSKEQEPVMVAEDTLHKEDEGVKGETDITMEETAVLESTSAEAVEEEQEASSTADVESLLLSTNEAEGTEPESTIEMDMESQHKAVSVEESGIDKEPEPESVPEEPTESPPIVETRSLRSGPKTVAVTPKHRHTAINNPETPDRPQEEPQKKESTKEQSKEIAEMTTEAVDEDDTQYESDITTQVPLHDLPRVAVVLVDVKKVHILKSITATIKQQEDMEEIQTIGGDCIGGDEDAVETAKEAEIDKADDPTTQVPLVLESADSSDGQQPEAASLASHTTPFAEEDDEVPVTTSSKRTRQSDIQTEKRTSQTPRRSSRKRPRVDYRDSDEKLDSSESLASEDILKVFEKDSLRGGRCSSELQSEEEESSEGIILSLCLDEEDEQSASEKELVVITGKNLRGRSVPSIILSPHSKPTSPSSTVISPKEKSPEKTPRQKRHSAKASPYHTSKSKRPKK